MKRTIVVVATVAAGLMSWTGVAAGQADPTTTVAPDTTVAPETTAAPDTTVAPGPTVPAPTVPTGPTTTIPQVLPGEWVRSGTIYLGSKFFDYGSGLKVNDDCNMQADLDGSQEFNIIRAPTGEIQAAYGYGKFANGDEAGMAIIQMMPLPMAVGVYRSYGTCNQDVMAFGSFKTTDKVATLVGSGVGGLPPYGLTKETYMRIDVLGSEAPAKLDLAAAQAWLLRPRG